MVRYEKALRKRLKNLNERNLILVGSDYLTSYISRDLECLGIPVLEHTNDDVEIIGNSRRYTPSNSFILAAVCSGHKDIFERLTKMGFRYNQDFALMNMGGYCLPITAIDPLLTYCRDDSEIPQYYMIGDGKVKIAVYGGSMSDEEKGGEMSWPRLVYFFLKDLGIDVTIYNGAVSGCNSAQELLKIVRDIPIIKPDIVISFSGVNDVNGGTYIPGFPFVNKYQRRMWENIMGLEGSIPDSMDMRGMNALCMGPENNKRSDYEIWLYHEKMMNAVCTAENIKFIGVLEPMISNKGYQIEEDLRLLLANCHVEDAFFEGQKKLVSNVQGGLSLYPYIFDMSDLFYGMTEMFRDITHCNYSGNVPIAKAMIDKLRKEECV